MWKYIALQASLRTIALLPNRLLYQLMRLCALLIYLCAPKTRRNVRANVTRVLGPDSSRAEIRKATRRIIYNATLYYVDLIRLPRASKKDLFERRIIYHGYDENLVPALAKGKGAILASCHFGNPEMAVQACVPKGLEVFGLTEPLSPERLTRLVDRLRSSQGIVFAPAGVANVRRAIKHLRNGHVVALMCDRDIRGPKALLPLAGHQAEFPTGPIELAMRTGAVFIPTFSYRREGDKVEVFLEEPLPLIGDGKFQEDVQENALRFLQRFEAHLKRDPSQWIVLESIWEEPAGSSSEMGSPERLAV